MEYILDLIFIALAVVMIILGAKKGLIKALLDGLSTIASGIIAYILATPVAKVIYDAFVRGVVKSEFLKGLNDSGTDFGSISELEKALEKKRNFFCVKDEIDSALLDEDDGMYHIEINR